MDVWFLVAGLVFNRPSVVSPRFSLTSLPIILIVLCGRVGGHALRKSSLRNAPWRSRGGQAKTEATYIELRLTIEPPLLKVSKNSFLEMGC